MSVHCMDGYLFNKAKNQFGNIKLFTLKKNIIHDENEKTQVIGIKKIITA